MAKDKPALATRSDVEYQNLEDQIRARAFELYEARGHEEGHDVDDWLRAEAEVMKT